MTYTVLILPAGQLATVVIKCLRKDSSLRIISADTNPLAPGLYLADKGYLVPSVTHSNFFDKIMDIITSESINVILPCDNQFIYAFSNAADRFSKIGVKVIASEPETLDKCLDKWKTYEYLHKIIAMPKSTIQLDAEHILEYIGLPAFIKPRDGSGSKNVHKLEDIDDLKYFIRKVPNPIVQEFIEGEHYSIDMLVNEDGKLLYAVTKNVFEISDGIPIKAAIKPKKDLILLAEELCKKLKFFGAISVNVIIDEKDSKPKPKLIDINPRTGISVILSVAGDYNVPLHTVYLAIGKPVELNLQAPRAIYMSRYHREIFLLDQLNGIIPKLVDD